MIKKSPQLSLRAKYNIYYFLLCIFNAYQFNVENES